MQRVDQKQTKAGLRTEVRIALKSMPEARRASASLQACRLLEQQELWRKARSVLFYAPLPEELDIWRLLMDVLAAGRTVVLPRFVPEQSAYAACRIRDIEKDVRIGKFKIRVPRAECEVIPLNRLDLTLVPGVAFDLNGRRLGRGKGFYDRLLADVGGTTCGVAFDEQIVAEVPVGPQDMRLSCILTPTRWHCVTSPRAVLK